MKITYDKIADAMYIYLNKTKVFKTVQITDRLLVDVDKAGKVLGIEILDASDQIKRMRRIRGKETELRIKIPALVYSKKIPVRGFFCF